MSAGWSNFSVGGGDEDGPVSVVGEDQPACSSCKRRKLRCSRETPTCSHCLRLSTECVYNPKQKPGLKPGAVEALTRRVAFLEQILLDEAGNIKPRYSTEIPQNDDAVSCTQQNVKRQSLTGADQNTTAEALNFRDPLQADSHSEDCKEVDPHQILANPLKRKFIQPLADDWLFCLTELDIAQHLPSQPLLSKIADFFCLSFHHWIPYIHKQRLQTRVREGVRYAGFDLVLHALVAVVLRHMDPNEIFLDQDQVRQQVKISRMIVETYAIRDVSVETLQALIFIVFDHLNNGEPQRAWPLIGSLTRTIDYLQLTTEPAGSHTGSLMRPIRLVQPPHDWTEVEERRRLFWVIFLLDRFCSTSTGWNTSLTADDVHRRLPADGGYFTREEPVITPYFGIWNKAAARIGRSLANVPAQYNEDDPTIEQAQGTGTGASPNSANGYIDASKLGAFAYCVEATESLSQVTTFFLQQRITWDKEHAVSWLTRFKELDLRLVHWKIFLPPKWKDSNISVNREIVDMDPNLTLAHITHNTSMILLHHPIAFPPKGWNEYVALPKDCSAQTCQLAAIETSNIVDKFLAHTLIPFVNVQFSFCAFVAAKALLFDHQMARRPLRPEFMRLIRDLWNMSERWKAQRNPAQGEHNPSINQAGKYAQHLERLHEACQRDPQFRFDLYDHSCKFPEAHDFTSPSSIGTPSTQAIGSQKDRSFMAPHARQSSITHSQSMPSPRGLIPGSNMPYNAPLPSPGVPAHNGFPQSTNMMSPGPVNPQYSLAQGQNGYDGHGQTGFPVSHGSIPTPGSTISQVHSMNGAPNQSVQDQSLLTLSDTLMDSQFLDMDRVITFEDANFFMPGDFRWQ